MDTSEGFLALHLFVEASGLLEEVGNLAVLFITLCVLKYVILGFFSQEVTDLWHREHNPLQGTNAVLTNNLGRERGMEIQTMNWDLAAQALYPHVPTVLLKARAYGRTQTLNALIPQFEPSWWHSDGWHLSHEPSPWLPSSLHCAGPAGRPLCRCSVQPPWESSLPLCHGGYPYGRWTDRSRSTGGTADKTRSERSMDQAASREGRGTGFQVIDGLNMEVQSWLFKIYVPICLTVTHVGPPNYKKCDIT